MWSRPTCSRTLARTTSQTVAESPHAPGRPSRRDSFGTPIPGSAASRGGPMAVTVSIPTILRTHTGGEKSVQASGSTVSEVLADLDAKHSGIKARLIKDGSLHRFVNIYVNDEDVRFAGGLEAPVADGDSLTILPAVAGGV